SWSRDSDGHVTDPGSGPESDNGLEWRIATSTRGGSNDVSDHKSELAIDYETGISFWKGCQADPVTRSTQPRAPAPAGNRHLDFDAPASGGRSYYFETAASENFKLDTFAYLDLPTLSVGERCAWSLGVCGTTDSEYEFPNPGREPPPRLDQNGDTGVTWTWEVTPTGPGNSSIGVLSLIDNGAGGTDHVVLWSEQYSATSNPGWIRLGLSVTPGNVVYVVGGAVGDNAQGTETFNYSAYGGVYVGVRNESTAGFGLKLDGTVLNSAWRNETTSGTGCDGTCPPRNPDAKLLDRSVEPPPTGTRTYAIQLPATITPFKASQLCFYMSRFKKDPPPVATVDVYASVNDLPSGSSLQHTILEPEELGWWVGDTPSLIRTTNTPLPGPLFLVLTINESLRPPVVEARMSGEPLDMSDYKLGVGNGYSSTFQSSAFAFKWTCTSQLPDITEIDNDAKTDPFSDPVTLDLTVTISPLAPAVTPAFALIGLGTQLLPLDPFGAPGCRLLVDPVANAFHFVTAGAATHSILVPTGPFVGVTLQTQWAVLVPSYNTLGLGMSNRQTITIR
ncbi:MAG: hypothetical protein KDC98_00085, partial [Planctomycetes bacterium]|nr:hypothetical protein [Planctomycetota bacterium]